MVGIGFERFAIPPLAGLGLAALAGAGAGLLIGAITLRLRGHYFALAMLAYPLAFLNVMNWLGFQEVVLPIGQSSNLLNLHWAEPRGQTFTTLLFVPNLFAIVHGPTGLPLFLGQVSHP